MTFDAFVVHSWFSFHFLLHVHHILIRHAIQHSPRLEVFTSTLISITFLSALLSFAYCTLEYYFIPIRTRIFVSSNG